ncbi:MAG TPA: DHA2 family efflux MFS transporter permease subunit [Candidatus Eisenbacteria bacterium]|nr:DHA2 family efflux MFS transporter permease subunit [Candidatus Eisenbacteria bacterium]
MSSLAGTWNGARPTTVDPYANRYLIAFTVTLAAVMELLDTSIVNVAIPHMMGTLGATIDQITWVSTGYIVANVIVLPLTGWLSALFGRRRYFAGSIALFTAASLFCGNAHSLPVLVFWRIMQGLGGGALLSTAQATLYETFPPEEYGTAMAIFGMGVMVGPTLGPTLGGYLTDAFSWPWIFYINLPFGIAAFLMTLAFIHDSRHATAPGRVDVLGLGLLILGIGSLQTMLERGERLDWFSSREIVALGIVSIVSLALFVWRELATEHPVVDLRILKGRQFALGVTLAAVLGLCLYGPIFLLPVYLQTLQGFTANQTGLVILPGAIASAITMAFAGRMGARLDGRRLVMIGAIVFSISMWRWSHFTLDSGTADYFWPLVLRGVGIGLVFVPLTNLSLAELPMSKIAQGTGLNNLLRQLGGSVGIAITATLLTRFQVQFRSVLGQNVNDFSQAAQQRLAALSSYLVSQGTPAALAPQKAVALVDAEVTRQAAMIAFERLFLGFGMAFLVVLPLVLFMKRGRKIGAGAAAH